jgi:DNA-binding NarL/FixJ family response regulator
VFMISDYGDAERVKTALARGADGFLTKPVNPQTYFTDLITRLVNGWPQKRIDELMPWLWVPERPP